MDEFTIVEDVSTYSTDDLASLIEQGNAHLDELFAIENPTDAQVTDAERIAADVDRLQAEQASRVTASTDRVSRMAALRDARTPAPEVEVEPEPIVEATADAPAAPVAVVASAPTAPAVIKPRPVVEEEPETRISIIASADVPDFSTGSEIGTMERLAVAVANRAKGLPAFTGGTPGGQLQKYPVATIRKSFSADLISDRGSDDMEVLARAADESRLPGGSLVAAGGWCAPSETLYDFCAGESTEGIWSVPEIQAKRGGVNWTQGPQFSDFYGQDFTLTEAQAISGTDKTCYTISCPTFTDTRLDATGLCIKIPILTDAAYPELTRRVTSGMLTAHQHKVSSNLIVKALALAAAVTPTALGSTVSDSLGALEREAEVLRGIYRLPLKASMEVVLPYWVRAAIREDLSVRTGVDLLAVSDEMIANWFRVRKMNVQWVYNWQPLTENANGYPATFVALIYPAGTFVRLSAPVITLSNVYDAASLVENEYTGLFTEEGVNLINRCYKAKKVTIALCQAGKTGIASLAVCGTAS